MLKSRISCRARAGTQCENKRDTKNPKNKTLKSNAHEAWLHQAGYHMKSFDQQVQRNASERGVATEVVGAWGGAVEVVFARGYEW